MVAGDARDRQVGCKVDSEWLLAEQMLARSDDLAVELLVKVVRDGAVNGIDRVVVQDRAVVPDELGRGVQLPVPIEGGVARVADDGDLGANVDVGEMSPACGCACELAAHESCADDREANDAHHLPPPGTSAAAETAV